MYRGDGGLKCGIGHALPEKIGAISVQSLDERDEYSITAILLGSKASNSRPVPEIRLLFDGIEIEFLEAVQKAHDSMHYFYVSAWEPEMASIAKRHSLIYTPVGAA